MDMNNICRLCLSFSTQQSYKLSEESDVLRKLNLCLFLYISLDDNLPSTVCSDCLDKIEEINYFKTKVTENQNTLKRHLSNGINDLKNFYSSLKRVSNVKEEFKETHLFSMNGTFIENKCENEIKEKQSIMKQEQTDFEESCVYSSDEEESLLSIKAKKNRNIAKINGQIKPTIKMKNYINESNSNTAIESTPIEKQIETIKYLTPSKETLDTAKDENAYLKLKCLTCFKFLESRKDLVSHYKQEHGKNVIIDQTIQNCYSKLKKEGTATYKCGKCDKVYMKHRDIRRHMVAHTENRPFVCNICGRTYKLAADIMMHGRAHECALRYDCVYECGFSTPYRAALKAHERRHEKHHCKYKCDKCGKGFDVTKDFEEHENVHRGVRPHVCDICGKAFYVSRNLKSHRNAVHPQALKLKRFVCVHCSLPCSSKKTLQTHLKEHGISSSYLCDFCGKSLSSLTTYRIHKRVHLGEKPFSCSTCNKSFTDRKYLIVHERTHTGERRYACKVCGKRYTQRSTLVRHMRQHTGNEGSKESLECSKCQKTFAFHSQVVSHEKVCKNNGGFITE